MKTPDLVCFSHLRWGFVFQRPNHLMVRAARSRRVFFIEEPVFDAQPGAPRLELREEQARLTVAVPHLVPGTPGPEVVRSLAEMVDGLLRTRQVEEYVAWYYTPMALTFSRHLHPTRVVYDCMDELSKFAGAPPELLQLEQELLERADVVFTGGHSLFRAKQARHPNVHAFPSSVDAEHFSAALDGTPEPDDQRSLPRPRIGFFGVVDERLDVELLGSIASQRPEWQLIVIGPVVKIDSATLPRRPNIHWLGQKDYAQLPRYLSGWDVAMMPFALNEATEFISPTKTLEYLAAGRPVVSTAIADVVQPYGAAGIVRIASRDTFVGGVERALADPFPAGREAVSTLVAATSWDRTWRQMSELLQNQPATHRAEREPAVCSIS